MSESILYDIQFSMVSFKTARLRRFCRKHLILFTVTLTKKLISSSGTYKRKIKMYLALTSARVHGEMKRARSVSREKRNRIMKHSRTY